MSMASIMCKLNDIGEESRLKLMIELFLDTNWGFSSLSEFSNNVDFEMRIFEIIFSGNFSTPLRIIFHS